MRHDDRPVLGGRGERAVALDDEVDSEAELREAAAVTRAAGTTAATARDTSRIARCTTNSTASTSNTSNTSISSRNGTNGVLPTAATVGVG